MPPITIVQGAQYGSEAKGSICGWLAVDRDYDYAVRTGAINAGHTVYYKGKPYAMQQLPVAWVNPKTKLVIGPGAYVHTPTLFREVSMITDATGVNPWPRIYIDPRASVHRDSYADESRAVNRHHLIGATGKGCAEAVVHKIVDRGKSKVLLKDQDYYDVDENRAFLRPPPWTEIDTSVMLTQAYDHGAWIMLEGCQGELLDFHLGQWPYVTSRQTTAAAWVAEAGLSPMLKYELVLVVRTHPIRVAGNSGHLSREITWPLLARRINTRLDIMGISENPMRVSEYALRTFEQAVMALGDARGVILNLHHMWNSDMREQYKDLLSEYSNRALEEISPEHQAELRKLFEFTTVTKKLRRVADMDRPGLTSTIERLRPSWIALTFLNYEYPELYGSPWITEEARSFAKLVSGLVSVVTTGPLPQHVVGV